jgi:fructose-1,6-bisphosphatase-3
MQNGTVKINKLNHKLLDVNFPTLDVNHPYELTKEEMDLLNTLEASFRHSSKLQKHVRFLFSQGAMYMCVNGNLLYHGCIPMTPEGEFEEVVLEETSYSGKALLDFIDEQVRNAYFNSGEPGNGENAGDIMWYLWQGSKSPLFGKDKMATFERFFVAEKSTHKETSDCYYKHINKKEICEKILKEFKLDPEKSHILNGHVPVKIKDGESPIKGGGLLFVIDGGMSKAYQKTTGIAGYTFISSSKFMALTEHFPYDAIEKNGTNKYASPKINRVKTFEKRITVEDTDMGKTLQSEIDDLKKLVNAYKKGIIKEKN